MNFLLIGIFDGRQANFPKIERNGKSKQTFIQKYPPF